MKFVDEFRDPKAARALVEAIHRDVTEPVVLMEICGGQTHTIMRFGLDQLLPETVSLVHGPGCPVCVTPVRQIDRAIAIARRPEVIFTSFGDMLRVPGGDGDLLTARAEGADVRTVYSPLDAVELARAHPDRQVVFFAVGFETTAPPNAMAVWRAHQLGLDNFSVLVAHVLVPPAMEAILSAPDNRVQGFLAAGHVCTVMGWRAYEPLAARYRVPIVVTGFEPFDLLQGVHMAAVAVQQGTFGVQNQYRRAVRPDGNPSARDLVDQVFEVCDRGWRGIGTIPTSGLRLRPELARFDAAARFDVALINTPEDPACMAGAVLQGHVQPAECPQFGGRCTPDTPLGAPMVSSEGACAAWYRYRRAL